MAGCLTVEEMGRIQRRCPDHGRIRVFIETGTFRGETTRNMKHLFDEVHTIELSRDYYEKTSRSEADPRITFHHGDSLAVLPALLPRIQEPAVFFLDAHFCQRGTAQGAEDVPLLKELALIARRPYRDLIIIDDVRLFGTNRSENWTGITKKNILRILRPRIPRQRWYWADHRILNDRMIVGL